MAQDNSIRRLIQDAKGETRAEIEKEVWEALPFKTQEKLGHAQLRRLIAAELTDPDQLEFTIDGEPYSIEDVPPKLLLHRGYRMIKSGRKTIERGEAYVAEAKARLAAQSHNVV